MTLHDELLARLTQHGVFLPDKPDETPHSTLAALMPCASDEDELRALVDRRLSGVPLAHLVKRQTFMDIEMIAGPEALIPRKETELLARGALGLLHELVRERGSAQVLDVCCGSGNIALALAFYESRCRVFGSDLSPEAIALAERNSAHLELANRCQFRTGDLFAPFDSPFDLVTCNPPYISTARVNTMPAEISHFEPALAFDGGPFGVKILTRLIREAPEYLKPASWLAFEVGLGQGSAIVKMMERSTAYSELRPLTDPSGEIRALLARTP